MARSLASKTNVIAPGGSYPFGRVRDNDGSANGTPANEALFGDMIQFFEKMMFDAGITANGNPENNTEGFQYVQAFVSIVEQKILSKVGLLKPVIVPLPTWNMDTELSKSFAHGIANSSKIKFISIIVIPDAGTDRYDFLNKKIDASDNSKHGGITAIGASNITVFRLSGGYFDDPGFSSTASSRGEAIIWYDPTV